MTCLQCWLTWLPAFQGLWLTVLLCYLIPRPFVGVKNQLLPVWSLGLVHSRVSMVSRDRPELLQCCPSKLCLLNLVSCVLQFTSWKHLVVCCVVCCHQYFEWWKDAQYNRNCLIAPVVPHSWVKCSQSELTHLAGASLRAWSCSLMSVHLAI